MDNWTCPYSAHTIIQTIWRIIFITLTTLAVMNRWDCSMFIIIQQLFYKVLYYTIIVRVITGYRPMLSILSWSWGACLRFQRIHGVFIRIHSVFKRIHGVFKRIHGVFKWINRVFKGIHSVSNWIHGVFKWIHSVFISCPTFTIRTLHFYSIFVSVFTEENLLTLPMINNNNNNNVALWSGMTNAVLQVSGPL